MDIAALLNSFLELLGEFRYWHEWKWTAPIYLLLLFVIPFFLFRHRKSVVSLYHDELWLFAPPRAQRIIEGMVRYVGLTLIFVMTSGIIFSLAHPVRELVVVEQTSEPAMISHVVDVSGSMSCRRYDLLQIYFRKFTEINQKNLATGVYYFSSNPLLEIFPTTNRERFRRTVARFTPQCGMRSSSYGATSGSEPGPSLWQALLDIVRSSDDNVSKTFRLLRERNFLSDSFAVSSLDLSEALSPLKSDAFRKIIKGKRIVLATDTDWSLGGDISVGRILQVATKIGIPVDLVAVESFSSSSMGLRDLIADTGGKSYLLVIESHIEDVVKDVLLNALRDASSPKEERVINIDHRPRFSLLLISLGAGFLWLMLRFFRPLIGL